MSEARPTVFPAKSANNNNPKTGAFVLKENYKNIYKQVYVTDSVNAFICFMTFIYTGKLKQTETTI